MIHVTMFPRFIEQCCKDHMTDEDVWLLDGLRRDVNRKIKDALTDMGTGVEVVDWWTLIGARNEMTVNELRRSGTVDMDNIHLTNRTNRVAAASLMHRLMESGGWRRASAEGWSECGWGERATRLADNCYV